MARPPVESERRLGRYRLVEKLADGGMGSVYAALRDGAPGLCVLKLLRQDLTDDATVRRRFLREARIGALLRHPAIAKVYGAGEESGERVIAMELVAGIDLETMRAELAARDRLLPPALVAYVALGVLDGLAYAHAARDELGASLAIVHRDLSPRNLMVELGGAPKIIDFGIVRGRGDDLRTRSGVFLGTPRFSSPEQALGRQVDLRSDLYSLSAILFEGFTGLPLVGGGPIHAVLREVVAVEPQRIDLLNPALPPELAAVIARGLAKDPSDRWPNAVSYRAALAPAVVALGTVTPDDVAAFLAEQFPAQVASIRARLEAGEALARERVEAPAVERSFGDEETELFVEFEAGGGTRLMPAPALTEVRTLVAPPARSAKPAAASTRRGRAGPWIGAAIALGVAGVALIALASRPRPAPETEAAPIAQAPAPLKIGATRSATVVQAAEVARPAVVLPPPEATPPAVARPRSRPAPPPRPPPPSVAPVEVGDPLERVERRIDALAASRPELAARLAEIRQRVLRALAARDPAARAAQAAQLQREIDLLAR